MSEAPGRVKVLFLCTGNSCRSQMAEGWARALRSGSIEACSAGTDPHGLNPLAVRVMDEAGVDISAHRSQHIDEFDLGSLHVVATVCDDAHERCPVIPGLRGVRLVHRSFDDPPRLARGASTESEALIHYRRVRDEIRSWVETMPGSLIG